MAFVLEDRVVETANNPGQGDFELLGAVDNNRSFVTGIGDGNTTRYLAVGAEGWEIGIGTVQAGSPDRLLRPGTVTKNSDGTTTPVNFTGTVTVACIASVEDVVWKGDDGGFDITGPVSITGQFAVERLGNAGLGRLIAEFLREGTAVGSLTGADGSHFEIRAESGHELRFGSNGTNNRMRLATDGTLEVGGDITAGGLPVATVSQATWDGETNFPIGHTVIARASSHFGRNTSQTVRLLPGTTQAYELQGTGTPLSGTWRMRGTIGGGDGVVERTA